MELKIEDCLPRLSIDQVMALGALRASWRVFRRLTIEEWRSLEGMTTAICSSFEGAEPHRHVVQEILLTTPI